MGLLRSCISALVCFAFLRDHVLVLGLSTPEPGTINRRTLWGKVSLLSLSGNVLASSPAQADEGNTAVTSQKTPYLLPEYFQPAATDPNAGRSYFPTLTPPFFKRATYRYSLGRNAWALEQLLVFANVTATIRTNVIQLSEKSGGGLWVHSPQWPTGEFCSLLNDLEQPVRHVVLPCNALEHKAPMKAFLKKYPDASVWISPGQYGPFGTCGYDLTDCDMGYRVDGIFPLDCTKPDSILPPWADEFDMRTLYADLPENAGPVSEVAFCHRPTQTLIATDAVVFVPPGPAPDIFGTYFDKGDPSTMANPDFWPKSVLQAVFLPLRTDENGKYPGYEALKNRLVRAPILRAFADARAPNQVREWVKQVGEINFDRICTSHFASPIAATPRNFVESFSYLDDNKASLDNLPAIACQDWELLDGLNQVIEKNKLGAPVIFDFSRGCR